MKYLRVGKLELPSKGLVSTVLGQKEGVELENPGPSFSQTPNYKIFLFLLRLLYYESHYCETPKVELYRKIRCSCPLIILIIIINIPLIKNKLIGNMIIEI